MNGQDLTTFDEFTAQAIVRLHVNEVPAFAENLRDWDDPGRFLIDREELGTSGSEAGGIVLGDFLYGVVRDTISPDLPEGNLTPDILLEEYGSAIAHRDVIHHPRTAGAIEQDLRGSTELRLGSIREAKAP